jgi:hypothetical protein
MRAMSAEPDLAEPDLHVIFSPSAAGSLKQALKETGRSGRVICPFDDFGFGPIAADDPDARARWVGDALGYTDWHEAVASNAPVLTESLSSTRPPIVWVSLNQARSYAGFLWWLAHMRDAPCSIIERNGLSLLPWTDLAELFDHHIPLPAPERERYRDMWEQLRTENAALRVIEKGRLVSKDIDFFDAALLRLATPEWQKMARIVAGLLVEFFDADLYQTGDLVLSARLADLADGGALEWRGEALNMQQCEMRLPGQAG